MNVVIKGEMDAEIIELSLERNSIGDIDLIANVGCFREKILTIDRERLHFNRHKIHNDYLLKVMSLNRDYQILESNKELLELNR